MLPTSTIIWLSVKEISLHNLSGPHQIRWRVLKVELSFSWGRRNSSCELWLTLVPKNSSLPFLTACAVILSLPRQPSQLCKPVPADYVSLVKPWLINLPSTVTSRELPREMLVSVSVLCKIPKRWHLEALSHLYSFQQLLSWKETRAANANGFHIVL